jgi:hypothetical protein
MINNNEENKKGLEEQVKKDTKLFDEKARLQKDQAKRLKAGVKKRELDEVKRKISLKTSEVNQLKLGLENQKNKERNIEQSAKNSGGLKIKETELANKKREKEKIEREIKTLEAELAKEISAGKETGQQKEIIKRTIGAEERRVATTEEELKKLKLEESRLEQEIRSL